MQTETLDLRRIAWLRFHHHADALQLEIIRGAVMTSRSCVRFRALPLHRCRSNGKRAEPCEAEQQVSDLVESVGEGTVDHDPRTATTKVVEIARSGSLIPTRTASASGPSPK